MSKKFISVHLSDESKKQLLDYCHANGFDTLAKFDGGRLNDPNDQDYHITVMYSNNVSPKILPNKEYKLPHLEVIPYKFELLGKNKDILTLVIKRNYNLWLLHKLFKEEYGLQSDYSVWKPHITIDYNYGTEYPTAQLPKFPLTVDKLIIEDLKD